ncbi:DUF4197 domain-containing protein [Psychroflexus sp. MES1-P1E]|uniref:DUF4197 domain-containing protein n=1 Tax=Psychroflexus sp. MES1-P1E TaxID=2058320 RepID=UPI002155F06F|nr:DUF4197 domain-containing protein [Psychroflexus sp. MES1-P1E]
MNEKISKRFENDVYYLKPMVKIELPNELETVENTPQRMGLESLTRKRIRALNKAAEEALKEATPLFIAGH